MELEQSPPTAAAPNLSLSRIQKPWGKVLAVAFLVGLASWYCGESNVSRFQTVFRQPPNWSKMNSYERDDYRSADQIRQTPGVETKNVALVFGALGIGLGIALGAIGGASRRSTGAALFAGGIGGAAGALLAAAASSPAVSVFYQNLDPEMMSLVAPVSSHSILFAAVGAGAGLGLGLGLGGRGSAIQATLGGLCGGLIGAVAYDLLMATVFARVRILDPIPKEPPDYLPRLLMHVVAAVAIALIALGSVGSRDKPAKTSGLD